MDSALSARRAADALGTSAPRVMRAVSRLGIQVDRGPGGRVRLRPAQLASLRAELGFTPRVPGLSPTEVRLLAALARAPLGLVSVRAVAARAGVSPTAAGKGLGKLIERGLVTSERRLVAAGRAREMDVLRADVTAPEWPRLAPALARVEPPKSTRRSRPDRVPARLRHLFWNSSPEQLDLAEHGPYVARRLLTTGDVEGLAWGATHLAPEDWEHARMTRGARADQRALAGNLALGRP